MRRSSRAKFWRFSSVLAAFAIVLGFLVVPAIQGSAATDSALTAAYGPNGVKAVQRSPAYPGCSGTPATYGAITMSSGTNAYSDSAGGPVDLANVVSGGAYLRMFASGDAAQPWGVAMYQNTTNDEVKWLAGSPGAWLLPAAAGYSSAARFSGKGQAYGLYSGGFLHTSYPMDYGNFFLIGQTWPSANTLTYTSAAA